MATPEQVIREIKAFREGKEVLKQVRKDFRKPVPALRKAIKAKAISGLPKRGGLNKWVAASKLSAAISFPGNSVKLKLKGGRNSAGGRSDIDAIDRGRVRAPSWGRKTKGNWHNQTVKPGFFTHTVDDALPEFNEALEQAVNNATERLRR